MTRNIIYKITITLLLLITWATGAWGQTYYVFKYNGHYVAHNGYTTNGSEICVEDNFSIEKCLWEYTAGDGNENQKYLRSYGANYWLYYLSNTSDPEHYIHTIALKSTAPQYGDKQDGWYRANTTDGIRRFLRISSESGYLAHNICYNDTDTPCWELVTTDVNTKKALGIELTKTETSYKNVSSAIGGGSDVISALGTYIYNVDATTVNSLSYASFTDAGTTCYWYDDSEHNTAPEDWGDITVASLTKTWSLASGDEAYASVNSSTGELTINSLPSTNATITLTCTIAHGSNSLSVSKTIELGPEFIEISSLAGITSATGKYKLASNFSTTETPADGIGSTKAKAFKGTLDGGLVPITGTWDKPLFNYVEDATLKNIIIENVAISDPNNSAGALVSNAEGATRIYNCGVNGGSVGASGNKNAGGLVGNLNGSSRVINCYSYANITGGKNVAGIVGYTGTAITQDNCFEVPMVVNCMFYGDITGGTTIRPVYGGKMIKTNATNGVNPYCFFRAGASFESGLTNIDAYNRSWPAEEEYLTRFEYYRSILNSNRKLCTWWVNGTNGTAPTDADIKYVGIAKWVLDPEIAPYPILKPWGKYPSIINPDPDRTWDPEANNGNGAWQTRSSAAPYRGKSFTNKLNVTVNPGGHAASGVTSKTIQLTITDMDTLNCDYGYYKVQLPYYNEVFGS